MSKVVLVTGASTGLGQSIATHLAQCGYVVYGTSRQAVSSNQPFPMVTMDVTSLESIQRAVKRVLDEAGRLDVLINNAGIALAGPVELLSLSDVQQVFDTNVMGIIRTVQAVLPTLRRQQSGLIINVSSIAAEAGLPFRGAYCASKAAVDRLTETLRYELAAFNVKVCSVQPGGTRTDINQNRLRAEVLDGNVYKATFDRTYQLIDQSVSEGISPAVFGPLIEGIIESPQPKPIYRVGKAKERLSVLLKRLFPTVLYEGIIRKNFKLD